MDSALATWKDLEESFSQGDMIQIGDIQNMISSFRQTELTFTNYFPVLEMLLLILTNTKHKINESLSS